MKKLIFAMCALALALLCACGTGDEDGLRLEKAQEVQIVSADGELVGTVSDDAGLDRLCSALDADEWEPAKLPEDAALRGEFILRQTETLKFGQSPDDLQMEELGRIRLYDAPYASLGFFGVELCTELSETAWESLNSYFE